MILFQPSFTPMDFHVYGRKALRKNSLSVRQFISHYGVTPRMAAIIWTKLINDRTLPAKARPKHLLMTLLWMKTYGTETTCCTLMGISENTFRHWRNEFLQAIKFINIVRSS
jgi:hypothetical protein